MRPYLVAAAFALGAACGSNEGVPPEDPVREPAPSSAPTADPEPPPAAPAAPPAPRLELGCSTVRHPLVERHTASLRLYDEGRFELRHVNTTPEAGVSTQMEGTYRLSTQSLELTPTSGRRRRTWGDGHRFQHGEDVAYCEWTELITAQTRTLPIEQDADGRRRVTIPELQTSVVEVADGDEAAPCADVRPPSGRGAVVGGRSYECVTPAR